MPSMHPRYEDGVPKDCCRIRCCNAEGQEYPGQRAPFPYANPTSKTKGIVKRKPVFSYDKEFTYGLLASVFEGVGGNADFERLSDRTQRVWCKTLDRCDLEAVDFEDCQSYIYELLALCDTITWECTGRSFEEWGILDAVQMELSKAWMHFVRLVWMRDLEWEDLVRCISDPNAELSVEAEYHLTDPPAAVKHIVSSKLLVPLQVWGFFLRAAAEAEDPRKRRG
mmetsp:Transcript_50396/g.126969  ORF Transcript_50396/g.126969 Transcript_50396/m.126969 type:complete len:224 (-) Transcript_50396:20-691(-)|eukprot:CAMPEP_0115643300 /NCGR_PEP_ID=MMETSP0272-20121206/37288_1 /TAXON_ID=71861 /ORGANISM="Scrippsiella trochoidea, Strain CCMP3099" /LENGTH=223 /DNA_ID=CAMNT_0003080681 /DNA_START=40 /DNA_END=711 /DNA_ORIENTATION=-